MVLLLDFLTSLTSNCSIFKLTRTAEAAARATRVLDDDVKKSMNSGTLTVEPSKKRRARIYIHKKVHNCQSRMDNCNDWITTNGKNVCMNE